MSKIEKETCSRQNQNGLQHVPVSYCKGLNDWETFKRLSPIQRWKKRFWFFWRGEITKTHQNDTISYFFHIDMPVYFKETPH